MARFRWPNIQCDTLLCKEILAKRPSSPDDWELIAEVLSHVFGTEDKRVQLKGRGCKERLDRLIEKYKKDDKRALKK